MLFDSTLRKELGRSFTGTTVVLVTIVVTIMLIRTLGMAAGGRVGPQDVALVLGYVMLGHLPTLLSLSLFIAVVSTLNRLHRDSEMVIWLASGQSLRQFVPPVMRFALPVLMVMAALTLLVWPWANQNITTLRERYEQRSDLSRVSPGQFQTSRNGERVFFIDKDAPQDGSGRNIFILEQRSDRESLTTAQAGQITATEDGARQLQLTHGARTDLDLDGQTRTVSRFESYVVRIGDPRLQVQDSRPNKARSTLDLWRNRSPGGDGELSYRIGMIATGLLLPLIGLGLASGSVRRAGSWSLLQALLTFVVYFNLVSLVQAWVSNQKIGLMLALFQLHGTAALVAGGLLWLRSRGAALVWPLPRLRRR